MAKTIIKLYDGIISINTLSTERLTCPMTLDSLAQIVDISDPARVILFARYGFKMPANIIGVIRCGTCSL